MAGESRGGTKKIRQGLAEKPPVAILGAGRVGTALGYLLRRKGYPIGAVVARSAAALQRAAHYTGGTPTTDPLATAESEVIIITVPDDHIEAVVRLLAESGSLSSRHKVIHMSGALPLAVLDPAKAVGAGVLAIHPLQSFADIEGAVRQLPGCFFGITCSPELRDWAYGFIADLDGHPLLIEERHRTLYHAAACISANYTVTLLHLAESVAVKAGMEPRQALRALLPLVYGVLSNVGRHGAADALTGPISRGDVRTVERHLGELNSALPVIADLYARLGLATADLAARQGSLHPPEEKQIVRMLREVLTVEQPSGPSVEEPSATAAGFERTK